MASKAVRAFLDGSSASGSHRRKALYLELLLLAYQAIHVVLQASYIYQGQPDGYDVNVPCLAMLICSRRLILHFASSSDPLDLGPHCWLLLRLLLVMLLCTNAGYALARLVQRHSFYAVLYVAAPVPLLSALGKETGLAGELTTVLLQACESAYYVGHLPVLLVKNDFLYWEPSYTRGLTLTVALNSAVILLLRLLVLKTPQLAIHSQAFHAQHFLAAQTAEAHAAPRAVNGGGSDRSGGAASCRASAASATIAVPAMPAEWEDQPLLLQRLLQALLVQPDRAHLALISVQAGTVCVLLLCFLHTYAWQAAAVSLWCNYAILYTLLRVRNSCS